MIFTAHSICISLPRQPIPLTRCWESAFLIGSTLPLFFPQVLSALSDLLSSPPPSHPMAQVCPSFCLSR